MIGFDGGIVEAAILEIRDEDNRPVRAFRRLFINYMINCYDDSSLFHYELFILKTF